MAETDTPRAEALLSSIAISQEAVRRAWRDSCSTAAEDAAAKLVAKNLTGDASQARSRARPAVQVSDSFELLVQCRDEADQRALFERLTAEGYSCRVLTL